ncbi:hypothetical protein [Hyalangium minutum]|uniref:hypothetical protein n=1 Tax=Hyalangium minutum TaxID=394096 RepID=UPI0005C51FF5|nr:hypothetical protein [Hyalangium minutum]
MKRSHRRIALRAGSVLSTLCLLAGCGTESAQPEAPSAVEQVSQNAESSARPPKLASLEAVPLAALGSATPSLVRATLAPGESATTLSLTGDDDKPFTLSDTGTGGDEKAGDGIFSGQGVINFDLHRSTQERIAALTQQYGPLTYTKFDDREVVGEERLEPQPLGAFSPTAAAAIPLRAQGVAAAINPARSLIITDPAVINDPTRTYNPCTGAGNPAGKWTFNHLMTEMANQPLTGIAPSAFVLKWLQQWSYNYPVNGWTVPARPNINPMLLNLWPKLSNGQLDLTRSPFKLVAIVNRPDLASSRGNGGGYGGGMVGELRFVFAAVDRSYSRCTVPFLVILEYQVPVTTCTQARTWGQKWVSLTSQVPGSSAYNSLLESLTQQVVLRNAMPSRPNGSAINQVRSNENWLSPIWEEREFQLYFSGANPSEFFTGLAPGNLAGHTTAQTPHDSLNALPVLDSYVNAATCPNVAASNFTIPLQWPASTHFKGANPQIPSVSTTFWQLNNPASITPAGCGTPARYRLSLNTCNGCHARETNTPFTHINQFGGLSPLLTSSPLVVNEPLTGIPHTYNEPVRRAQVLDQLANQVCPTFSLNIPPFSH